MLNFKWTLFFLLVNAFGSEKEAEAITRPLYTGNNPEELGKVDWIRNLDQGIQQAEKGQKPIFLLFQEVPGCATCRNYGQEVLSHPLIVEAIETLFVPVAIYNNKQGADAKTLQFFGEPAWNNPVVRIIDNQKKDIVQRISGNYTKLGVVQSMLLALKKEGNAVPTYLELLEQALFAQQQGTETATLGMYCFWTGEKNLGKLKGVVETQPGFMNGHEVVQVQFDPSVISYTTLVAAAQKSQCASQVYAANKEQSALAQKLVGKDNTAPMGKFRLDNEPKYYLSKTLYKYIPMTAIQATKANSLIGQQQSPDEVLSPRQLQMLNYIKQNLSKPWKEVIGLDLEQAWALVEKVKA
ncbi:MAG: VPGUxxT family thioredoxin-like (seleno)protein, type 2 [Saprospiraceae bacterium]